MKIKIKVKQQFTAIGSVFKFGLNIKNLLVFTTILGGTFIGLESAGSIDIIDEDTAIIISEGNQPNVFDRLEVDHAEMDGLLKTALAKLDFVQLRQNTLINMIGTVQMQIDAGFSSTHPHGPPQSQQILDQILEEAEAIGCAVFPGKADCELLPESILE